MEIENGPERDGPFLNALAALVRHRGADRVPHATDLLAHEGQRANHGDADEDQDEPVLGVGLPRLRPPPWPPPKGEEKGEEPIHHDHPLHPRAAQFTDGGRNGPFRYGTLRRPAAAESVSTLRGCRARPPPASSAP